MAGTGSYTSRMSRHDHPHGHDHAHGHDHDHGHGHDHDPARGLHIHDHDHAVPDNSRVFALGAALNIAFVVVEVVAGLWADSLALLADAGHNFGDVLGLLLAGGAVWLSRRAPTARFTYGLQGSTILAALANAMLLILAVGAIGWEAIGRLRAPVPVPGTVVMAVAAVGIEKINSMCVQFSPAEREQFFALRRAFDAGEHLNPGKQIPSHNRCAEYGKLHVRGGALPFAELPRF